MPLADAAFSTPSSASSYYDAVNSSRMLLGAHGSRLKRIRKFRRFVLVTSETLAWFFLLLFALYTTWGLIWQTLAGAPDPLGMVSLVQPAALIAFSLAHSTCALGFGLAMFLFLATLLVSFGYEALMVNAFATGSSKISDDGYRFTDDAFLMERYSAKLAGVPLDVPLSYYMLIYICYQLASIIATGRLSGYTYEEHLGTERKTPKTLKQIFMTSILAGFFMTSWNLCQDPIASTSGALWTWDGYDEEYNRFFGVPVWNFVGWFLLCGFIVLLTSALELLVDKRVSVAAFCRRILRRKGGGGVMGGSSTGFFFSLLASSGDLESPLGLGSSSNLGFIADRQRLLRKYKNIAHTFLFSVMPVVALFFLALVYVTTARPYALRVVAFFVLGLPVFLSLLKISRPTDPEEKEIASVNYTLSETDRRLLLSSSSSNNSGSGGGGTAAGSGLPTTTTTTAGGFHYSISSPTAAASRGSGEATPLITSARSRF